MRDLNEDLDEQFREAVDRYTLRPVSSQWDELSGKIISVKHSSAIADPVRSKYKRWGLLLAFLILVPVALIVMMPIFNSYERAKTAIQIQDAANGSLSTQSDLPETGKTNPPMQSQSAGSSNLQSGLPVQTQSAAVFSQHTNFDTRTPLVSPVQNTNDKNTLQSSPIMIESAKENHENEAFNFITSSSTAPSTDKVVAGLAPLTVQNNAQKNLPLQHLESPHRQGFYLGLSGGPLLTQVKNQGLKKSGFDIGLIAGYTLSKKFSIESGIYYTQQYYYVSGKYYNEFAGVHNAASLEGRRSAFEIPLTLKYNFIRKAGGNFFATAGMSTFIGVNDKVMIHVAEGAIPPSVHFDYGSTSYLPSYMNFSVGYEYKIGKSANIRIEPYVQIPLNSNTGNAFKTESSGGSIQVFNTGIHIVISRFVH